MPLRCLLCKEAQVELTVILEGRGDNDPNVCVGLMILGRECFVWSESLMKSHATWWVFMYLVFEGKIAFYGQGVILI